MDIRELLMQLNSRDMEKEITEARKEVEERRRMIQERQGRV
jgi:hypothetical protein